MKVIGYAIIVIAIITGLIVINTDTTVMTASGDSVYNNGLMNKKTNGLLVAGFLLVTGAVLFAISEAEDRREKTLKDIREHTTVQTRLMQTMVKHLDPAKEEAQD